MIEFALVVPFLALMAFGTAEYGLAWVANNRVEGATSTAARVGSSTGADPNADASVLVALKAALSGEQLANLQRVVIFKPTDANGSVPTACLHLTDTLETGVSGTCNSYSGATIRSSVVTSDPATTNLGARDDSWLGASRKDTLAGPPDYIGVYVRTTYSSKTGALFGDMTITRTSIYRIQPDIDG